LGGIKVPVEFVETRAEGHAQRGKKEFNAETQRSQRRGRKRRKRKVGQVTLKR
jgi:hypothetical protein